MIVLSQTPVSSNQLLAKTPISYSVGENSHEPFCGGPLEGLHHKSIIASFSRNNNTNNNSTINEIFTTPTRKEQVFTTRGAISSSGKEFQW